MPMIDFGGTKERVVTREEMPLEKAREVLAEETVAIIGYGVQGPAQALNLRDNGFNVIVGQRKGGASWEKALADGWKEGETLFDMPEALKRGTVIACLLSDAGTIEAWPAVKAGLTAGKCLLFSHGFAIAFSDQTKVTIPDNVDAGLVAPKGSGRSVRVLFQQKRGINSSFGVYRNFTGRAEEKILAYGIGIGSGYLFETTMEREAVSDLTGERGTLMGALAGIIHAQYKVLRANGHTPSEAFNETVEELTQSLVPLVGENGMDWMYANCSTTAQRGALDWAPRFEEATRPIFEALYDSVKTGNEARITIEANSRSDYRPRLDAELQAWGDMEVWKTGRAVRKLRP